MKKNKQTIIYDIFIWSNKSEGADPNDTVILQSEKKWFQYFPVTLGDKNIIFLWQDKKSRNQRKNFNDKKSFGCWTKKNGQRTVENL